MPETQPVLLRNSNLGVVCQLSFGLAKRLVAPLNRLNALLSLLQHSDRCRALSAIGSAIVRPLSRPISHPNASGSPQPPHSKPLGGLNRVIVVLQCLKPL